MAKHIDSAQELVVEKPVSAETPPTPKATPPQKKSSSKLWWAMLAAAVLLLLSGWIWGWLHGNSLENKMAAQAEAIQVQARQFGELSQKDLLQFSLNGISLAFRSEWIRSNYESMDQYVANLAQNPRVLLVQLINERGTVILSSDKHIQGKQFKAAGLDQNPLQMAQPWYFQPKENEAWGFVPVMGIDKRLGTLMVQYRLHVFTEIDENDESPKIQYDNLPQDSVPNEPPRNQMPVIPDDTSEIEEVLPSS